MENVIKIIDGYKTIIIGIAMIIVGIYNGDNNLILQGFGLITLRLGVGKIETAQKEYNDDSVDIERR